MPQTAEVEQLVALHESQLSHYRQDAKAAEAMAGKLEETKSGDKSNEGAKPKPVETADLAGWTVVANVLLNLDEAVTK